MTVIIYNYTNLLKLKCGLTHLSVLQVHQSESHELKLVVALWLCGWCL
jgi:hypothetical protein